MADALTGPLSEAARVSRRQRRLWAVPGSNHDRLIAVLRVAFPASVGVLAALLAAAPLTSGRDISFVLAKDRVQVAHERLRVTRALYRGQDSKGQPFALSALSAVQATSTNPVLKLDRLAARIDLQGGPGTIVAPTGRYNMTTERIALDGPVSMRTTDGYALDTQNVDLDLKTRALVSRTAVTGKLPLGRFSADHMWADLDQRTVLLTGNARLHIDQRSGTARR
ncbi:MAG TPA: LPS export ABC transporter periplasmic protein LptC [Sphingomonas sp.]